MIKIIGIGLISFSVSMFGAIKASEIRKASQIRKDLCSLLYAIQNGIEFGKIPLIKIYSNFSSKVLDDCGFLSVIKKENLNQKEISKSLNFLSEGEATEICNFFTSLGKSHYSKEELTNIKRFFTTFESSLYERKKKDLAREYLYKKIGVIFGICIAIILI